MEYLLGIDVGTKTIKSIIYDFNGNPVGHSSCPYNIDYFVEPSHPEWAFINPDKLWYSVVMSIKEVITKINKPDDIVALSVTGIGMDGLPIDANGNYLYPFISWQCARTEPQCKRWVERLGKEKIFEISGRQVLNIDSIYRILWVKENLPEIFGKIYKWLLIEDYINYKLCGSMVTDYSMASTTSLLEQKHQVWSDELIEFAGISKSILPDLQPSGTILGQVKSAVAQLTGLSDKTKVVLGGHDYLCAMLAYGGFEEGSIMNIAGTWDMIITTVETPLLTKSVFRAGLKLESHAIKGKYAIVGDAVSTHMIDYYRQFFSAEYEDEAVWAELMKEAENIACGSEGIFFLPHCNGAACPKPDTRSSGAFVGISDFVTKASILRSIFEGLNYQFNDMVIAIEKVLKKTQTEIVTVGYDSKNRFYMQNKADITGKIIKVPNMISATCLGVAIIAGIACGVYKDIAEASKIIQCEKTIYIPNEENYDKYQKCYEIYKKIYPALKQINYDIFDLFRA